MPVSLRDVAAKASVSFGTVSRVLNGNENARIAPETRERIRRVARELGYHPNVAARSLVKQRTNTIGLMLAELRNPFFQEVLEEMESRVSEAGYQILLDANTSAYGHYHDLRKLASWIADGVLIWTIPNQGIETYLGERAHNLPVVYLGHLRDDGSDSVAMDLYGGGLLVAEYLFKRGYRRLCYVANFSPENFQLLSHQKPGFTNNQLLAFQHVCRETGVSLEIVVLDQSMKTQTASFQAAHSIAGRVPSERPDVVICHNDWIAHFVYMGLQQGGLRVPNDIALVGFDGTEDGKNLPNGPLTTVRTPIDALCRAGLDILLKRIGGDAATPPQQILIQTELIVGGTT